MKKFIDMNKIRHLLKKAGMHAAIFLMMALALYLLLPHMLFFRFEWMRMMLAMIVGAYLHKPCADWVARKLLHG